MAAPHRQPHYTPAEYLAYERAAATKSEYIAGQIVAMSGASRAHNLITWNLTQVLGPQLRGQPCEAYVNDMRVKVTARGMYTYPDLVVVCGEPQLEDAQGDTLLNPTLIIEVLSPSTQRYDREAKFTYYQALPSLQEYLLIAQDRVQIEHFVRTRDNWLLTAASDPAALIRLTAIGCTLPVAAVYEAITFPADDDR